ncbi:MAG: hypothetical protein ABJ308_05930 [Halieaceae bacterium]
MNLRQKIENNPTIWLLTMLLAGFLAGFSAYKTIIEVSGRVTVAQADYDRMRETAARLLDLETQIAGLKAKEGATPSGHSLYISSKVTEGVPENFVSEVRLDERFYLSVKWLGLSAKGYYEQKWQIWGVDGLVAEQWHPFVPKADGEHWIWAYFTLHSGELAAGKYRIRIFLNDARFEDRELVVLDN